MLDSKDLAKKIKIHALEMTHKANSSHIGTCLSMADILAVLYSEVLNYNPKNPLWDSRDRLVLSKGHGTAILYSVLCEVGFFESKDLDTFCCNDSYFTGHVNSKVPGIEVATGSLGHGLPIACGIALALKKSKSNSRVFTISSDGELDEGSVWESVLFAPHHNLNNLNLVIDYNKIQSFGTIDEVLSLEPLTAKFESFNWSVSEIDGHNHKELIDALSNTPVEKNKPSVIIAHTIKGKGIDFMENKLAWHYKSPNTLELKDAINQVNKS